MKKIRIINIISIIILPVFITIRMFYIQSLNSVKELDYYTRDGMLDTLILDVIYLSIIMGVIRLISLFIYLNKNKVVKTVIDYYKNNDEISKDDFIKIRYTNISIIINWILYIIISYLLTRVIFFAKGN